MKKISFMLASAAVAFAAPALSQTASEDAAEAVEEAAAEAVRDAAEPTVESAGDAVEATSVPPAIEIASPTPRSYERDPRPDGSIRNWITQADYPVASWVAGEEGRTEYRIAVNALGQATDCTITGSSGFQALDEAICPLMMERAKFDPATDADDVQVAGAFQSSHNWRKKEPDVPQMSITFQYLHDAKGVTGECKFLRMENLPEKMLKDIERDRERGRLCPGSSSRPGVPYRDQNGVPVAKLVTATVDIVVEDSAQ